MVVNETFLAAYRCNNRKSGLKLLTFFNVKWRLPQHPTLFRQTNEVENLNFARQFRSARIRYHPIPVVSLHFVV